MRVSRRTGKLEPKKRGREIETVVIVRELCELCDGTGLIQDQYTYDCYECHGRGMVQVSKTKEVTQE